MTLSQLFRFYCYHTLKTWLLIYYFKTFENNILCRICFFYTSHPKPPNSKTSLCLCARGSHLHYFWDICERFDLTYTVCYKPKVFFTVCFYISSTELIYCSCYFFFFSSSSFVFFLSILVLELVIGSKDVVFLSFLCYDCTLFVPSHCTPWGYKPAA